jgi:hypothetical protein
LEPMIIRSLSITAFLVITVIFSSLGGCTTESGGSGDPLTPEALTVHAFMNAFNDRSVSGMLSHIDDNLRWYRIKDDRMVLETYGRDDFRTSMRTYFDSLSEVSSEIESLTWNGPFVSVRERVTWTTRAGSQSLTALAVFELKNGKIVRAWYYNASD